MTRTCLITGATGAVGPRVVSAFRAAGFRVRTLTRHAPPDGLLPADVAAKTGDVSDGAAVRAAVDGADTVVHLAALLHVVDPPPELRPEYERVNVRGTETIVNGARAAGVQRVVLVSTIAVYGPAASLLDEQSPPRPDTFYGQTKLAAERISAGVQRADGVPLCTILRPGAVYGRRIKGNYRRLVEALARHRFVPIGDGVTRRTLVHDRDLASAIVLAASAPAAAGCLYNVSDGAPHALRHIIEAICAALGRRPPRLGIPASVARAAASTADAAARLAGMRRRSLRSLVDKYLEDAAVNSKLIQVELGFVPQVSLAEGWRDTVEAVLADPC